MVWLYVPELEVLNSDSLPQSVLDSEPFVMSRGKPMLPQSLSRKWRKGGFIRLLSGLTCEPSRANRGVAKWMSLVRGSLASPGRKPDPSRRLKTHAGYGTTSRESFARFDPHTFSWKTSQVSLMGGLTPFSARWPKWGSLLNGVASKRPMLAHPIAAKDCSSSLPKQGVFWPTPTATDNRSTWRPVAKETVAKGGWRGVSLPNAVELFPTPTANPSFAHPTGNAKIHPGYQRMWPTPVASDGHNSSLPPSQVNWDSLPGEMIRQGEKKNGGHLNPAWVEWLMGWPIGWTELEPVATELSHSKQPTPSEPCLKDSEVLEC